MSPKFFRFFRSSKWFTILLDFRIPFTVLTCLLMYLVLLWLPVPVEVALFVLFTGIVIGSWRLVLDTLQALLKKSFALDYIAILAILVGLLTQNYFIAGVIVLMMSGGNALEDYAQQRAKKSLTALKNRIPNQAQVVDASGTASGVAIESVEVGSTILVRKGEVVPLDGQLVTEVGSFDESSLTGEPYPVSKEAGDVIRSGTLNVGESVQVVTTVLSTDSTYSRIVALVKEAENAQTPFTQLADKLSMVFTLFTLALGSAAYFVSGDPERVLAVLVIATPCPLILATPIALIGGMNAAAQRRIIMKRLASLEALSDVQTVVFDKTGTLTLGQPLLESIETQQKQYDEKQLLSLAAGLEKNSLHPYARAIVAEAQTRAVRPVVFAQVEEEIGLGIRGAKGEDTYQLASDANHDASQVTLTKNGKTIGVFRFADELKENSIGVVQHILDLGLRIWIFTGDTVGRAQQLLSRLPAGIELEADLSPEDKKGKGESLQKSGNTVVMIGDGINDAPALAVADVGVAFSHQEHTAASEAADVVLLGRDFSGVLDVLRISRRTMTIAKQSMYVGLGLSILGMILAVFGFLPPIAGAIGQEVIDVAVILNALRTTRMKHA